MRDGIKWRRLRTPAGRTYWTVELPDAVVRGLVTQDALRSRLMHWKSGETKRERQAQIKTLASQGIKPDAIASMFPSLSRGNVLKYCAAARAVSA